MSNTAAVLEKVNSPLTVQKRDIPTPASHQILIKNHAIATNPVDYMNRDTGMFVKTYPTVLGSDISGTVETIGDAVTHFKKGDRVTGWAAVIYNGDADHGGFQEYTLLNEHCAAKFPDSISFEEGAILPMSVATSGTGIFLTMKVPKPSAGKQKGGFLVWAAASSVGTAAVQIAASLGYTVFASASPQNHEYIKSLGASQVFDYKDPDVVESVISAAKSAGVPIKHVYCAYSKGDSPSQCVGVLEAFGGGKLCLTLPWPEDVPKPDSSVEVDMTEAYQIVSNVEFGRWLFNEWLEESLVKKTYVPSPAIEKVEGGIGAVQKALDLHQKGLSGKKLVLSL
ncbi:hypothetical protein MMC14_003757 [Varicellaria rhodocarpa]|nr:hypothetical protein [Varicellaria rhodocarpa]